MKHFARSQSHRTGETIPQSMRTKRPPIYNLELFSFGSYSQVVDDQNTDSVENPLESTLTQLAEWARKVLHVVAQPRGFRVVLSASDPDRCDRAKPNRIAARATDRPTDACGSTSHSVGVFSWGQARFFLSGWYGVGTALRQLQLESPATFETLTKTMTQWAPLHYLISNVATSLAATDLEIMRAYASMVDDESLRHRCM